ncbi:nuclear transport factor 2 family protein [Nocardia aurantiaca]|uniref:SnoaL-like domain-containing protein n=1 Tax=Nocardia aurantiaca TaxID=2675850 RepID=A0A6I3KZ62_9NOCA|nr:hypothetical protein [Nocardia aurantiaca]MTE16003.1 hypothetical protein [Nocardia aurantiaca]
MWSVDQSLGIDCSNPVQPNPISGIGVAVSGCAGADSRISRGAVRRLSSVACVASGAFAIVFSINLERKFAVVQQDPKIKAISEFFEAYGRYDLDGMKAVLTDDIAWTIPGHHALSGTKHGWKKCSLSSTSWRRRA